MLSNQVPSETEGAPQSSLQSAAWTGLVLVQIYIEAQQRAVSTAVSRSKQKCLRSKLDASTLCFFYLGQGKLERG